MQKDGTVKAGEITPNLSVKNTSSALIITLTPTDIKIGLTLGVVAAAIFGVLAVLSDGTVVVAGLTVSSTVLNTIIAAVIGVVTNISWIWWDGSNVTITIPSDVIRNRRGVFIVSDPYHTAYPSL